MSRDVPIQLSVPAQTRRIKDDHNTQRLRGNAQKHTSVGPRVM